MLICQQKSLRRGAPGVNFARRGAPGGNAHGNLQQIVTAPPVPGNVTEQNGERKHGHHARTDSGGTPPRPVSAACPPNLFTIHSSLFTKNARYRCCLQRLPCERELVPQASEGFIVGNSRKNGPMWKPASLWNPPGFARGKTTFGKGGFGRRIHRYCSNDTGFFPSSNRQRGKKAVPNPHKPERGQVLKPSTRAKAKGQSRMVPPGGFLRGEQFERERVVPPLSRLLCLLSCRSKKVRPCWQALAEG